MLSAAVEQVKWMRVEERREEEPEQEAPFGRRRTGEGGEELVRVRLETMDLEAAIQMEKKSELRWEGKDADEIGGRRANPILRSPLSP